MIEAGNFSDMGEVAISPHRHLCAKNVRIMGVGGEEPAAYGPSMRQMARYMRHYPLKEFVTHGFGLRQVEAAMPKAGKVHIVAITDRQYENIRTYRGKEREPGLKIPNQLALF